MTRIEEGDPRPCVLIAHKDAHYLLQTTRRLRALGCEVVMAPSGPEVRRLAWHCMPSAVILDVDLAGESGWLTSAKLLGEQPWLKVILVADQPDNDCYNFADFIGVASLIDRRDGSDAVLDEVLGEPVSFA